MSINIKPGNRGKFTRKAKAHHFNSPQSFARQVLAHRRQYSGKTVKEAVFAENARKWHHGRRRRRR